MKKIIVSAALVFMLLPAFIVTAAPKTLDGQYKNSNAEIFVSDMQCIMRTKNSTKSRKLNMLGNKFACEEFYIQKANKYIILTQNGISEILFEY